jgi:inward rectifier potassium channel
MTEGAATPDPAPPAPEAVGIAPSSETPKPQASKPDPTKNTARKATPKAKPASTAAHAVVTEAGSAATSDADAPKPRKRRWHPRVVGFSVGTQEFVQTGLTRLEVHDPYHFALSLSGPAFVALVLCAELVINTVFALLYLAVPGCVANARPGVFSDVFFFSIETLATVGYGVMAPATTYGHIVSATEIVTGMGFTAIMTGLLFVRFSKPRARIVYAAHPVVTTHDGKPTLMLRIGNARARLLTDARVTVHLLVPRVSAEGFRQRMVQELRLTRGHLPVFAIIWTLMHEIDEASPLHGLDAEAVAAEGLRLFVIINARDQALGQDVSDIHTYAGEGIRFGMRYVDAVRIVTDHRTVADYGRISAMEPDPTWAAASVEAAART